MGNALLIFAAVAIGYALYTWGIIWSRLETRVRGLAVLGFVILLGALGPASLETLGWHRPHWAAVRLDGDVVVLSFKLVRDEAIYLYLDAGPSEPRAISLPWSDDKAEELQEKQRQSLHDGRKGKFKLHFGDWEFNRPLPNVVEPVAPRKVIPKPTPPPALGFYGRGL